MTEESAKAGSFLKFRKLYSTGKKTKKHKKFLKKCIKWCMISVEVEESGTKWYKVVRKVVKSMFMGEYDHTLDPKGRMIVPAKFRDELGERFILTLGLDGCLFAYPMQEWEQFLEGLKKLPGTRDARQLQRHFLAGAADVEVDKQGRFLIPQRLREQAGLEKDVLLVGVLSKIEIWSRERWEQNNCYDNVDDIAEHMAEYGLNY